MYPNRSSKLLREIKDKLQLWQVFVYPFNFTSAAYFHFGYMIDAPRFRLRHIVSASGRIMATVFSPSDENKQKAKNIGRLVDDKEEILLQKDSDDSSETV